MSWIIPENKLDISIRTIIDRFDVNNNVCIKGFLKTGKTLCIMHLIRKSICLNHTSKVLLLVLGRLEVEYFKMVCQELGIRINIDTYFHFKKNPNKYDRIFCDDVQNITASTLTIIKENAGHVIVSINPDLKLLCVDFSSDEETLTTGQVINILSPTICELNLFHGKTNVNALSKIVSGTDKCFQPKYNNTKQHTRIRLCKAQEDMAENEYIFREVKNILNVGHSIGVFFPTNNDVIAFTQYFIQLEGMESWEAKKNIWGKPDFPDLNHYLVKNELPLQILSNYCGEFREINNKINVMTYYNSKGVYFDYVFMPYLNSILFINANEQISRNLFVMAATRCHYSLFLSYTGYMHRFLYEIKDECIQIDIENTLNGQYYNRDNIFAGF